MDVGERVERDGRRGTVVRVSGGWAHVIWDDGEACSVASSELSKVGRR